MKRNKKKSKSKSNTSKNLQVPLLTNGSWLFSESYKAARTNLTFILPGGGCKVIGITSALPGVGKSISAINLAMSFGQIDKKILLVDCDMRLPTVATKLGIKSVPGIADVLAGEALITQAIQHVKKIDVLPAGNIPSDPTWLLQSEQLQVLISILKKSYDYVILDFPPITTVSDALILSDSLDGYVMVIREDVSTYRSISYSLKQVEMVNGKVLGFLYNDIKTGSGSGKYYKYKNNYYYYKKDPSKKK